MAKKLETEKTKKEEAQKIVTKYDRKMERRRLEEEKARRSKRKIRYGCITAGICLVAALLTAAGYTGYQWYTTLHNTFFKVGEHEVKGVEYEYYYTSVVNNYLSMYGAYISFMGLDTSKDFSKQYYTDNMTWKDYFDQMAVEQLKEVKALSDDAKTKGFTYEEAEKYAEYQTQFAEQAKSASVSVKEYYKLNYGRYATEARVEPYIKESLLAAAYYDELVEQNKPEEQAVMDYYNENKQNYDKVDYRNFTMTANLAEDASEDVITNAMDELFQKAEEMQKRRKEGEDFKTLCLEYAAEEERAAYEEEEKDASLSEGASYSGISSSYADWLYEENRSEGDIEIFKDDINHKIYVVEFVKRTYDDTTNDKITDLLANQAVNKYIEGLTASYTVTDVAGRLDYLKQKETTVSSEADSKETSAVEESTSEETTGAQESTLLETTTAA